VISFEKHPERFGNQRRHSLGQALFVYSYPGRAVSLNGPGKGVCLEIKMETQKATKNHHHLPIFPLGVVLLPDMTMPLHIFEERYKIMVRECLERDEPFGIVFFDGKQIHKVGCTAQIIEVLKYYEDGRMDIVVQGVKRFFMDEIDDRLDYLVSGVFYIDDIDEPASDEDQALLKKAVDDLARLDALAGRTGDDKRFQDMTLRQLSFIVPGSEGFAAEERQRFLEMTSARERLDKGLMVLERVIARAKINREVTEIIGGNGHVRAFMTEKGVAL
jgi:Lon protease-like protein